MYWCICNAFGFLGTISSWFLCSRGPIPIQHALPHYGNVILHSVLSLFLWPCSFTAGHPLHSECSVIYCMLIVYWFLRVVHFFLLCPRPVYWTSMWLHWICTNISNWISLRNLKFGMTQTAYIFLFLDPKSFLRRASLLSGTMTNPVVQSGNLEFIMTLLSSSSLTSNLPTSMSYILYLQNLKYVHFYTLRWLPSSSEQLPSLAKILWALSTCPDLFLTILPSPHTVFSIPNFSCFWCFFTHIRHFPPRDLHTCSFL